MRHETWPHVCVFHVMQLLQKYLVRRCCYPIWNRESTSSKHVILSGILSSVSSGKNPCPPPDFAIWLALSIPRPRRRIPRLPRSSEARAVESTLALRVDPQEVSDRSKVALLGSFADVLTSGRWPPNQGIGAGKPWILSREKYDLPADFPLNQFGILNNHSNNSNLYKIYKSLYQTVEYAKTVLAVACLCNQTTCICSSQLYGAQFLIPRLWVFNGLHMLLSSQGCGLPSKCILRSNNRHAEPSTLRTSS